VESSFDISLIITRSKFTASEILSAFVLSCKESEAFAHFLASCTNKAVPPTFVAGINGTLLKAS